MAQYLLDQSSFDFDDFGNFVLKNSFIGEGTGQVDWKRLTVELHRLGLYTKPIDGTSPRSSNNRGKESNLVRATGQVKAKLLKHLRGKNFLFWDDEWR